MDSCSEHEDAIVVYTGTKCPACQLLDDFEASEDSAATLRTEIDDLREELKAAEKNVARLESDVEEAQQRLQDLS